MSQNAREPELEAKTPALCQEEFKRTVHHKITKEQQKQVKVQCGWYTERQMKETLKMSKSGPNLLPFDFGFEARDRRCGGFHEQAPKAPQGSGFPHGSYTLARFGSTTLRS